MTVKLDLDMPATAPAQPNGGGRSVLAVAVVLALLLGVIAGVASNRIRTGPDPLPVIRVEATAVPGSPFVTTVVVWYRDGGSEDISALMNVEWRPTRPVRLVTAVAEIECRINVDDAVVATDRAENYRYALCAWEA